MGRHDPRIDAYIARSAAFARPILARLRADLHAACPEVEETLKWSHPSFTYHGIFCGIAAFKQHCSFGFWKEPLLKKEGGKDIAAVLDRLGRMSDVTDLPSSAAVKRCVKLAMRFNVDGTSAPKRPARPKPPLMAPPDLKRALAGNRKAREAFEGFSPSHRREYVEWITEAKQEATRLRRLETTIAWLEEGKPRNWKYMGTC
jgi:uncharacterized protein YdeI (YjbR/CyaY-like superfamily)